MEEFIIRETINWGKKEKIRQSFPFIDHAKLYAFKPRTQRGPAREAQTFIVSYMYTDSFTSARETEFLEKVNRLGLTYHKSETVFRDRQAYRILVLDAEVDLQRILVMLNI